MVLWVKEKSVSRKKLNFIKRRIFSSQNFSPPFLGSCGTGFSITACRDNNKRTVVCKKLVENHVTSHHDSFHLINHGKITEKSWKNHGEIMKKSWSRYEIWYQI